MPLMMEATPRNACFGLPLGAIREGRFLQSQRREGESRGAHSEEGDGACPQLPRKRCPAFVEMEICANLRAVEGAASFHDVQPHGPHLGALLWHRDIIDGCDADAQACRLQVVR